MDNPPSYKMALLSLEMDSNTPKTILITGCSSGIGHRAATMLKARGYRVFASARRAADVDRLAAEGFEALRLDLDEPQSVHGAVDDVLARTGGSLYAVFNNGAYGQPGAVEDLSRDVLRAQFETNLFGWAELSNRLIAVMREQGQGRLVQNSSLLGLVALPLRGAYNASKYALEGLTDTLRLELRGSGVFVSLIEPGPIESRFRANALAALEKNIDIRNSVFKDSYQRVIERLNREGPAVPFTLPADAVVRKLIHALESPRPKARYYVTVPTHLFATLRRLLSTSALDRVLSRVSSAENR